MTTQYTPILKLALPVTGELSGTWGDVVNDNITSMVEQAIAGLATINTWTTNSHTLTTANGTTSESRCAMLVAQDGAGLSAAGEIICPASTKLYVLKNASSYAITLKTAAGTGVSVPVGETSFLFCDGTNVNACVTAISSGVIAGNLIVNGNTTLGDSSADTLTVNAQVSSGLIPSADNTYDIGSAARSWKDLYIDGTATMALVAISGGTINGVSIGATTPATFLAVDNISIDGNTIASTDTNGNIVVAPNGTGDVQVNADTLRVGDVSATATITTNGTGNLVLSTNEGTNSGTVQITQGTNGNIALTPNGTGKVLATALTTQLGVLNTDATATTNGTGSLILSTNNGTNSGTVQITQGTNGTIAITPNGTGVTTVKNLTTTGTPVISDGTANTVQYLDASKNLTGSTAFTFDGSSAVLNVSSAGNALRITQTGAGNALLVEDSANPDSSPFVIDSGGKVVVGHTAQLAGAQYNPTVEIIGSDPSRSGAGLFQYSNDVLAPRFQFNKTRGTDPATQTVVQNGDELGSLTFSGSDGTNYIRGAVIATAVDGAPGTNDMPGRIVFSTTADGASSPSERMRIDSAGRVGIGTTALNGYGVRVQNTVTGNTTSRGMYVDTTAASDVTAALNVNTAIGGTAAASFTLGNLRYFLASQGAIGAGSTVNVQYGFVAESTLTGATTNFGFYGGIASGTNRWNFYAAGTAQNYFAGTTLVGTLTNTNTSTLVSGGTISETVSSVQYLAASQFDVGTAPNKIPLNQYLGALAYRSNAMVAVPASATAAGNTGDVAMDSSYFYVCTAPNTWKRVAIATW